MSTVKIFPNNPFEENTHIVYDDSGQCVIIDPGMSNGAEENAVVNFIKENNLKPVLLLNTHCHIDHILGNKFVFDQYGLKPQYHAGEQPVLDDAPTRAPQFGLRYELSPQPDKYLEETGEVKFGNTTFKLLFAPGHSPASLCFYDEASGFIIGGDVLFRNSVGRSDLPGGNHQLLIKNIEEKLFTLPDSVTVYPGHGIETTIGYEKINNPFF